MNSRLVEKLAFALEPVAVSFTDDKPSDALQFEEGKRGCVGSMLVAAAEGKTAVFDEKTYGCAGGGVGLCFGDTFTKNNHPTECLLSTGDEALAAQGRTFARSLGRGERFFASPELAAKWKAEFPYAETPQKYVVFMPLGKVQQSPDLVCIFANPDQLSALVILAGFSRGSALNVIAPFGAACHSIAFARKESQADCPKAVMGFFDISQRHAIPKDLLTLTMPFTLFKEMDEAADESCLSTKEWERIATR
ncbi:MAG: DUF169 domain-containing protein [Eggerthellaceae bacterium]|nr:DUF169 domain-containing protein [Eggerthellaceae bacterium]MDR2721392.1 DUF169 domain-containing protein [Coriobacteriaceae bacterium]